MSNFWTRVFVIFGIFLISSIFFRLAFVNFIDQHEVGYKFNMVTGKMEVLRDKGYIVTSPLTLVNTVDIRPFQVCISGKSRVLNCKLIRFNPGPNGEYLLKFISLHGRSDYSAFSISDASQSETDMYKIMMSYAYESDRDSISYPFLEIIKEIN